MFVEMDLNGDIVRVESYEQLQEFLKTEAQAWSWITKTARPGNLNNVVVNNYNEAKHAVSEQARHGQPLHVATSDVSSRHGTRQLLYTRSVDAQRIEDIRTTIGEEAAVAAYGLLVGALTMRDVKTFRELQGVIAFAYPALTPVKDAMDIVAEERSAMKAGLKALRTETANGERSRDERTIRAFGRSRRRGFKALRQIDERSKAVNLATVEEFEGYKAQFQTALNDLAATTAAYKAHMELQAPVEYWKAKAAEHRRARRWLLLGTVAYFLVALGGLSALFYFGGRYLIDAKIANNTALFVIGGGLATLSGVVLWAGRLITRLYLSEHHLAHDAEERAVMTKTYLALTAEKAASDAERSIILTALFRATSDGVVKDDAAVDTSLGGIIAKAVAK